MSEDQLDLAAAAAAAAASPLAAEALRRGKRFRGRRRLARRGATTTVLAGVAAALVIGLGRPAGPEMAVPAGKGTSTVLRGGPPPGGGSLVTGGGPETTSPPSSSTTTSVAASTTTTPPTTSTTTSSTTTTVPPSRPFSTRLSDLVAPGTVGSGSYDVPTDNELAISKLLLRSARSSWGLETGTVTVALYSAASNSWATLYQVSLAQLQRTGSAQVALDPVVTADPYDQVNLSVACAANEPDCAVSLTVTGTLTGVPTVATTTTSTTSTVPFGG